MKSNAHIQTPNSTLKKQVRVPPHSPSLQKVPKKKALVENDDNIFTTIYDEKLKSCFN